MQEVIRILLRIIIKELRKLQFHRLKITLPAHTHEVDIPTHTHTVTMPEHEHDIQYGIYTDRCQENTLLK